MKTMDNNSIDFIVTDSPYGISFMSKQWDQQIPPIEYWKEMLRICKPGSMMACAGLPRMIHRLGCIVEDSGWNLRDMLIHIFGSGFPKSHNFGRKLGNEWEGYGTALKPAWEGWLLFMKPLDGTFAQNAEKWGVGGINIDESRIGTIVETWPKTRAYCRSEPGAPSKGTQETGEAPKGRWPSNLILSEEAAEELDKMTGVLKIGNIEPHHKFKKEKKSAYGQFASKTGITQRGDSGGASRFFYCPKASPSERNAGLEGMPLKEKSGCYGEFEGDGRGRQTEHQPKQNSHPTVKPIALMKYILKLLAPPGSPICLDPFCGSGSTLVAAKELGINCLGIEKEAEYIEIAGKRVDAVQKPKYVQTEF